QLQPFSAQAVFEIRKPSGVSTWARKVRDKTRADGIDHRHEHERYGSGRPLQCRDGHAATGKDDVRRKRNQFLRFLAQVIVIVAKASFNAQVRTRTPAEILQTLSETCDTRRHFCVSFQAVYQHPNASLTLLRTRKERPRNRPAE